MKSLRPVILISCLLPVLMWGQGITVTPANPVVGESGSVTITADRPVVFTLSGAGSLTTRLGSSTVFRAPSAFNAQHGLNGCMVLPSDSVFNTPVANLPVNSNSDAWTPYTSAVGFGIDYTWGTNVIDNSVAAVPQFFHYSTHYNGVPFQIPAPISRKRETGSYTLDGNNDHHLLSVNHQTCQFYETYQDGLSIQGCPECTAASGWTYQSTSYRQPSSADGGGATDAAGLPLAPLTLHLSEIKAGAVNHALRFSTCVACIGTTPLWPATGSTGVQPGAPPMGARFRLKSSLDISGFPPDAQVVLTALKQYGMFLADVGLEGHITASSDVTEDAEMIAELRSIEGRLTYTDFEAVDESSFVVSPDSNQANPANPYQKPANYALLNIADVANPSNQVSVPIALQPVLVGTPDPVMVVQAGSQGFPIPYWVNGTPDQTVAWSISPATGAGAIAEDGFYTAPDSLSGITKAVLTISSVVDPNASSAIYLTIIPPGVIRIDSGSQTGSTDESGASWLPDLGFETGSFNTIDDNYPTGAWGSIPSLSIWQTFMYTWGDDILYRLHVPNGNYQVGFLVGIGSCDGSYDTGQFDNGLVNGAVYLQGQNQIAAHNFDFGISINHQCRKPSMAYIPVQVKDTSLLVAMRATTGPAGHSAPLLNGLTITPDSSAPHIAIDAQKQQSVKPGSQLQLYLVAWYTDDTEATWKVIAGPGTVNGSGLYTAPASLKRAQWATVQAIGKTSHSRTTVRLYIPANGPRSRIVS